MLLTSHLVIVLLFKPNQARLLFLDLAHTHAHKRAHTHTPHGISWDHEITPLHFTPRQLLHLASSERRTTNWHEVSDTSGQTGCTGPQRASTKLQLLLAKHCVPNGDKHICSAKPKQTTSIKFGKG